MPEITLESLAARVAELEKKFAAIQVQQNTPPQPVAVIEGVDPADVWAAAAEADAGRLTPHDVVFARLRARP